MQNATHILEVGFEGAILVIGLAYLASWLSRRKLTNRQVLFLFVISFAGFILLDLLRSVVPAYVLIIGGVTPLMLSQLGIFLKSKPASQVKMMFARKPSELPEKSE